MESLLLSSWFGKKFNFVAVPLVPEAPLEQVVALIPSVSLVPAPAVPLVPA